MTQRNGVRCLSEGMWLHIPLIFLLMLCKCTPNAHGFPDQGKWDYNMSLDLESVTVPKSLFAGSEIFVQLTCEAPQPNTYIHIQWLLIQTECWPDSFTTFENIIPQTSNDTHFISQPFMNVSCINGRHIPLPEYQSKPRANENGAPADSDLQMREKRLTDHLQAEEVNPIVLNRKVNKKGTNNPVYTIQADGVYLFALIIKGANGKNYNASVHIEMRSTYGFLSAVDWPLLPFYGVMCLIYVLFGLIWLLVSFMQWRDLLRIQFWIGGVILLGMFITVHS